MRKSILPISFTGCFVCVFILLSPLLARAESPNGGKYLIGAGDILEIVTWKEKDLSRDEVLVRIDGYISFPLLNDVKAAGHTTTELTSSLQNGLKDYIANPVVTVTVKSPASKRFYILGEVKNTGEYPLYKDVTVLQAFAIAGGFTEWASKDEILLLRKENGKDVTIRVDYKEIADGENLDQNVPVKSGDTIIVP